MSSILVTGGAGQVAYELARHAEQSPLPLYVLPRTAFDITDVAAVNAAISKGDYAAVINCAAYTAVDKAESERERAFAVNRDAPGHLAAACAKKGIPLIQLSTDYVFDGLKKMPYTEEDKPAPLSVYGDSKWQGEEAVRTMCPQHMILRITGVFSAHGNNFVKTIFRLAKERKVLRIVADQFVCPTPAADIAQAILRVTGTVLAKKNLWGTYHYCSTPQTTWHDFGCEIVKIAAQTAQPIRVENMVAITTAEYPTPAKRPLYSILDCRKFVETFSYPQTSWEKGLKAVMIALSQSW